MGVDIRGPCNLFCDNNAVVLNSSVPESMLKKKHAAVNYHRVREAIAAGTVRVVKEDTATNVADMLTKCLAGPVRPSASTKTASSGNPFHLFLLRRIDSKMVSVPASVGCLFLLWQANSSSRMAIQLVGTVKFVSYLRTIRCLRVLYDPVYVLRDDRIALL